MSNFEVNGRGGDLVDSIFYKDSTGEAKGASGTCHLLSQDRTETK